MTDRKPCRVLVVEDEMLVAMLVEDMLLDIGCEVVAISTHIEEAVALAGSAAIDFAVLDVNLNGKPSFAVADALIRRGIPYVFATGYGAKGLSPPHADAPTLQKPFEQDDLEQAMRRAGVLAP